jgi:hypothetical protein
VLAIQWLVSPAAQAAGASLACATSGVQVVVGDSVGALLGVATVSAPTAASTIMSGGTVDLRCTYGYSYVAPSSRPLYVFTARDGVADSSPGNAKVADSLASLEALGGPGLYLLHFS